MKRNIFSSVNTDKFWANLPGTDRWGILWSPVWLKAEMGNSLLNDIKVSFCAEAGM